MEFEEELESLEKKSMRLAIDTELGRAMGKHSAKFNSEHEKYAVLLEEFEEFKEEIRVLESMLSDYWKSVKTDSDVSSDIARLKEQSWFAYSELIHTLAMIEKEVKGGKKKLSDRECKEE